MSDKPRNPLSINIPAGEPEVTRFLVLAESEPLGVADSWDKAYGYCQDLERPQHPAGVELRWHLVDEADPDGPWAMYMFDGDEHVTGYTVTPITHIGSGA